MRVEAEGSDLSIMSINNEEPKRPKPTSVSIKKDKQQRVDSFIYLGRVLKMTHR